MNFVKVNKGGKPALLNLDLVTDIYSQPNGGCKVYFAASESETTVDQSIEELHRIIEIAKKADRKGA